MKVMTSLHIQRDIAGAVSHVEGIAYVASMIFGKKDNRSTRKIDTVEDGLQFARLINGG